ncbi:MAG TPA: hypothetical protein VFZ25_19220 [Chloroflexota bacterium]|nr:hypothetical protein [Chloroflexota bacterium]
MGANRGNGRGGRAVPFRWLIVAAIWFLTVGPILIFALLGLIVGGTTGALVGGLLGIIVGIVSYLAASRALQRAER